MALVSFTWASFYDGAIVVTCEHDDVTDQIESYSVVNNHPSITLRATLWKNFTGQQWRQHEVAPGQSFSDTRPFPGGVRFIEDVPLIQWETF